MFELGLVGFSLVPLGLLLLFWRRFPRNSGIHPIYRQSGIESMDKRTEVQDATARRPHMRLSVMAKWLEH
jgi:hypothetical protein